MLSFMGVRERLSDKLGREPTEGEVEAARARRNVRRSEHGSDQSKPQAVVIDITVIAGGAKGAVGDFYIVHGATTKRQMLFHYEGNTPITTLDDITTKATAFFTGMLRTLHLGDPTALDLPWCFASCRQVARPAGIFLPARTHLLSTTRSPCRILLSSPTRLCGTST